MILKISQRKRRDVSKWHWRFAWLPKRISETEMVWLALYSARLVCNDQGGWGSGATHYWEKTKLGSGDSYRRDGSSR